MFLAFTDNMPTLTGKMGMRPTGLQKNRRWIWDTVFYCQDEIKKLN